MTLFNIYYNEKKGIFSLNDACMDYDDWQCVAKEVTASYFVAIEHRCYYNAKRKGSPLTTLEVQDVLNAIS